MNFKYKIHLNDLPSDTSLKNATTIAVDGEFSGLNPLIHLIGFLLFRFFDITKLGLIKKSEKIKFGIGIMADDFLAALATVIILTCFNFFII